MRPQLFRRSPPAPIHTDEEGRTVHRNGHAAVAGRFGFAQRGLPTETAGETRAFRIAVRIVGKRSAGVLAG